MEGSHTDIDTDESHKFEIQKSRAHALLAGKAGDLLAVYKGNAELRDG
jgi:hypothetical protein